MTRDPDLASDAARHHRAAGRSRIAARRRKPNCSPTISAIWWRCSPRAPIPNTRRRRRGSPISTACWPSCAAISAIPRCRRRGLPTTCRYRCARSTSASRRPRLRSAARCSILRLDASAARACRSALRRPVGDADRLWRGLQRPVAFHQGVPRALRYATGDVPEENVILPDVMRGPGRRRRCR